MMIRTLIHALLIVAIVSPSAIAENWPHWRGDRGNGISMTATPPTRWSPTENVKWKAAIPGRGSGSPVVWNDRVFVVTAVGESGGMTQSTKTKLRFDLLCFDRANGSLRWQKTATRETPHEETHSTNGFASASPCTDGKYVYAPFGSRGLYCYDFDGNLVWSRNDFGQMETRNSFGEGSSPVLAGNKIIVPWDHEGDSFLFALDKLNGKTIWKTPRDEPSCWATPLVIEVGNQKQIIMNGQNKARAYDLETGREIWSCGGQTERPVASPVAGDGRVFIGSGHRGSFLAAFDPTGRGDVSGSKHVLWSVGRDTPDIASLLLSDGRLYFYKAKVGVLSCHDAATGEKFYGPTRVDGLRSIYASPVAANGFVYLSDREGTTVVIRDSDKFEIVATNSIDETLDATPALVDEQLFLRGERHLFCIED